MVRAAGCGVDKAAGNTRDEETVVDLEFDGVLEGLLGRSKHAVELLSLGYCPREAVEDEAVQSALARTKM